MDGGRWLSARRPTLCAVTKRSIPDGLADGPILRTAALDAGITATQLRGHRLWRPTRGVYVAASVPDDLRLRCRAVAAVVPDAVFSHATAAQLLGLPVVGDGAVHLTLPRDVLGPRRAGVRAHQGALLGTERTTAQELAVTTGARTFVDLAASLSRTDLAVLGDAMLRRRKATVAALEAAIEGARGRRGIVAARAALPLLEPRTDSPSETRTRLILMDAGFPRPRANVDLFDRDGQWIARPDLVYDDAGVIFEYDGESHFATVEARRNTAARNELLRDLGWEVVVVTALDLRRPETLVRRAEEAFARAATRRAA